MKLLILILVALGVAIAAAQLVSTTGPGYVLLSLKSWTVELSLTLFVAIIVGAFILLYLALRLLAGLWKTPKKVGNWRQDRLKTKASRAQTHGMMELIEGNWPKAEKRLLRHLDHTDKPLLNYIGAAHAAQEQGDLNKRDAYLAKAMENEPDQRLAIGLTQAKLQYQTGQLAESRKTLQDLRAQAPKNKRILSLLIRVCQELQDSRGLMEILPAAQKLGVLPADDLDRIKHDAGRRLLTADNPEALPTVWESFTREFKKDPKLIAAYAEQLIQKGEMDQCEALLRKALKQRWDSDLVHLYGQVHATDAAKQLKTAEKWTEQHGDDPHLLLSLARICIANELWGKARSYLETSIAKHGPAEAYQELGRLLEQLGEPQKALSYYRKGLETAAPKEINPLPAPAATPSAQPGSILSPAESEADEPKRPA